MPTGRDAEGRGKAPQEATPVLATIVLIKVRAKTQAVIAKSSAESELYGVVRGACEGLGMKSLCADLGSDVGIRLELDATAAKGILDRQGLAKVRHIDVNCLWLQGEVSKPPSSTQFQIHRRHWAKFGPQPVSSLGETSGQSEANMGVG